MKVDCTFPTVCLRCGAEGHGSRGCEAPRSPRSEEDLRRELLAKRARWMSPSAPPTRPESGGQYRGGVAAEAARRPLSLAGTVPAPSWYQPGGLSRGGAAAEAARRPLSLAMLSPAPAAVSHRVEEEQPAELEAEAPICIVCRSPRMNDLQERLRFAMVAYVGGPRPAVSKEQVYAALQARLGITCEQVSVHNFLPEDFLLVFASVECRNRVAALPSLAGEGFSLLCRHWNKQSQAVRSMLKKRVELFIEGIPPHAWDLDVVEDLLGTSCVVGGIAPESNNREDLSTFRLSAWTEGEEKIPSARTLVIPEPASLGERTPSKPRDSPGRSRSLTPVVSTEDVETLRYKVLIHVVGVEEEEVNAKDVSMRDPSASNDGFGGWPDSGDLGEGLDPRGRRARLLPWSLGVPDRHGGGRSQGAGAGGGQRSFADVVAASKPWGLPPIGNRHVATRSTTGASAVDPRKIPAVQITPVVGAKAAAAEKSVTVPAIDKGGAPTFVWVRATKEGPPCAASEGRSALILGPGGKEAVSVPPPGGCRLGELSDVVPKVVKDGEMHRTLLLGNGSNDHGADRERSAGATVPGTGPGSLDQERDNLGATIALMGPTCHAPPLEGPSVEISASVDATLSVVEARSSTEIATAVTEETTSEEEYFEVSLSEHVDSEPRLHHEEEDVEDTSSCMPTQTSPPPEAAQFARLKVFCANMLKKLAPPLLREVEALSVSNTELASPTPRRRTRSNIVPVSSGKPLKKASAAENVLLKALGIVPEPMVVNEEAIQEFWGLFDSPMKEEHLRVVATIFGKAMPPMEVLQEQGSHPICAH
ncbi:unnamed protein product [Alopecurus aequalis]